MSDNISTGNDGTKLGRGGLKDEEKVLYGEEVSVKTMTPSTKKGGMSVICLQKGDSS